MSMPISSQKPTPTMPVARESVLHSEPTIYRPEPEAHPDLDATTTSVPSGKKYLIWLAVAFVVFAAILLLIIL